MTKLYKLTDKDGRTYGGCQWGEGVTHETDGQGELCGPGWIHAYTDPLLAVLLNQIHANFDPDTMLLWWCKGKVGRTDSGLKVGSTKVTTIRTIPGPEVTTQQRVRFAILCAREVYQEPVWSQWAAAWLDGTERGANAASDPAAYAASYAASSAANAAAYAASSAANAAAYAASSAANAAAYAA